MPTGVTLRLYDDAGIPLASTSGIQALWWDVTEPKDFTRPIGKNVSVSTDSSGYINLDLSNVTGLASGDYGFLLLYKLDGTDHQDSPTFSGKVQTSTISSGDDMYYYDSGWTRPSSWLTLPTVVDTDQKFVGLHAVYEDGNFVALKAQGNYVVNWGDGTGDINVSSGVTAEYNIPYANVAGNTDVGIADAFAVTFQDTGDTVTKTAHGYLNGQKIAFSVINTTTGISTYTNYYIVNKTADTFQVAATQGGTALSLTNDGTGSAYVPKYRQAIVTVTMQSGQTFSVLDLHIRHSGATSTVIYTSGFLDIAVSGGSLSRFTLGAVYGTTTTVAFSILEQASIVNSVIKNTNNLFQNCYNLQSLPSVVLYSGSVVSASCTFQDTGDTVTSVGHGLVNDTPVLFTNIVSTTGISTYTTYFVVNATADTFQVSSTPNSMALALTTNGSGNYVVGVSAVYMFSNCYSLQSVPLFNTAAVTNMSNMFSGCYSLRSVPLFNTEAVTNMTSMFNNCYLLQSVPLFNTAAVTNMSNMFSGCYSLQSVPLFNTAAVTNMSYMFGACYSLQSVPLFNTAAVTNMSYMFNNCYSLQSVPLFNTAAVTSTSNMFNNCYSLRSVPLFNTEAVTSMSTMFYSCYSLQSVPAMSAAAGTSSSSYTSMFNACRGLSEINMTGHKYTFSVASCKLSAAALDKLYSTLATVTGQTITVTSNYGTTGDNPSIATAKGWTVTGS